MPTSKAWWSDQPLHKLNKYVKFHHVDGCTYNNRTYDVLMKHIRMLNIGDPFYNVYRDTWTTISSFKHRWTNINSGRKGRFIGRYLSLPIINTADGYCFYDIDLWWCNTMNDKYKSTSFLDGKARFNSIFEMGPDWNGPWSMETYTSNDGDLE